MKKLPLSWIFIVLMFVTVPGTVNAQDTTTTAPETTTVDPATTNTTPGDAMQEARDTRMMEAEAQRMERQEQFDERKDAMMEDKMGRISDRFSKIIDRFSAAVSRLENIIARVRSRMVIMQERGVDTSPAEAQLLAAEQNIANATAFMTQAQTDFEAAIASETPLASFGVVRESLLSAKNSLIAARQATREAVTYLKGFAAPDAVPSGTAAPGVDQPSTGSASPVVSPAATQ